MFAHKPALIISTSRMIKIGKRKIYQGALNIRILKPKLQITGNLHVCCGANIRTFFRIRIF